MLERCMRSVESQTHPYVNHFLVADGHPQSWIDELHSVKFGKHRHFSIPNCGDYGDTPRAIGSAIAINQGFDAVCFLDADCWYEPDHVVEAVSKVTQQTPIVTTARTLRDLNGDFIAVCQESDGVNFCDTNCYLIARPAFNLIGLWTFKEKKLGTMVLVNQVVTLRLCVFQLLCGVRISLTRCLLRPRFPHLLKLRNMVLSPVRDLECIGVHADQ